jgi:2-dehydro-3-deoxyphosphogluconate aldolase / (4S)-4-hydroxy-2-oxoglutarate aldolase
MDPLSGEKIIAVVRLDDLSRAVELARALAEGGVRCVEFTYTNRAASDAISNVGSEVGENVIVGAGTVLDAETARTAILAGARFIVSPTLHPETIRMCRRYGVPIVCGAFTPTEILTAAEAGADYVKVHPASLGGPRYFRDVLAPLPHLRLIPSGGVSLETAPEFLRAGAVAVAVGGDLVGRGAVGDLQAVSDRARAYVEAVSGV